MNSLLDNLGVLLQDSTWLAPLFAFIAGVFTSFTPCALSSIPLVIGYVGGYGKDPKRAFCLSVVFVLGSAVTFTALGVIASSIGNIVGASRQWWYLVLGVLMVLMALQTWEVYSFVPSTYLVSLNTKKGYAGAFIAGILGGVFSSPCATPVLVVLLGIVAGRGSILWGSLLLMLYALGHGALALVAGTSVGFVQKLSQSNRYAIASRMLRMVMGTLILLIGFYMFYLGF
jgi:cytochrome c-type biogenesis protein